MPRIFNQRERAIFNAPPGPKDISPGLARLREDLLGKSSKINFPSRAKARILKSP